MYFNVAGRGTIAQAVRRRLLDEGYQIGAHTAEVMIDCSGDYDAFEQINERVKYIDRAIIVGARRIITMAGGSIGSGKHVPGRATYVAAKYFLYGYVEQVAHTLPPGHTINMIAPGPVLSNMTRGELEPSEAVSPNLTAQCIIDLMSDECTVNGKIVSAQTGKCFALRGVEV
jgi:NAD(P)-dependent dehydrogenase (short-subunit alcohol dehydrogenase family)